MRRFLIAMIMATVFIGGCAGPVARVESIDKSELLKASLVRLDISVNSYNQFQPWRRGDVMQRSGYAVAVGGREVITTAMNVANATFIKARVAGQNEFVKAMVKVIDYESNLCLLELDEEMLNEPLVAVEFSDAYKKGAEIFSYWLVGSGDVTSSRGYLDRAEVNTSLGSFAKTINFVASSMTGPSGKAELFFMNDEVVGIGVWSTGEVQEVGLVPSSTINKFLSDARDGKYEGFAQMGFAVNKLIDPAMRGYLKLPGEIDNGVYVSEVYSLGTGSDVLNKGDVIVGINGNELNAYGRFDDERFGEIRYHYLISELAVGAEVLFDVYRDGELITLKALAKSFDASEMLVPYHEYDKQPEYIVTGGFVIQKMTRPYFMIWGEKWRGKVPSHLYNYYGEMSFKPSDERQEIAMLSFVMPADINLGYQKLGRMVIDTFNGMKISKMSDILIAQQLNPESKFDVIEFEQKYPSVVIPRGALKETDAMIAQNYGIDKLVNIED